MNNLIRALIEINQLTTREIPTNGNCDLAGRWYPNHNCPNCKYIRTPSRAFPYSLLAHSRSLEHIASEFRVDVDDLKRLRKCVNSISKDSIDKVFTKLNPDERTIVLKKLCRKMKDAEFIKKFSILESEAIEITETIKMLNKISKAAKKK